MITKHDDLLGTLIHDVAHLLRLNIDAQLKPFNLTRAKWLALGILSRTPGLTQKQLAERLELGQASTGRLVDRLQQRDYVERRADDADRRVYRLFVTAQASQVLQQLEQLSSNMYQQWLADVPATQIDAVSQTLIRLKQSLLQCQEQADAG